MLRTSPLILSILLVACGREVTPVDHKLAGVGHNPAEIGPTPEMNGGLFEYNWVDFAGAGLPLGMLGLVSYTAVGPDLGTFRPPYALVTSTGFVFEDDLPNTDTLFGTFAAPPSAEGTCYTNIDPRSYLNSVADVGTSIAFQNKDGSGGFVNGRRPVLYAPDLEAVFPYYIELEAWRVSPRVWRPKVGEGDTLDALQETVFEGSNFVHGAEVEINFPGAIPLPEASFGSIPMPLAAWGKDRSFHLPTRPTGLMVSWTGPRYGAWGQPLGEGENKTCVQYAAHGADPASPEDCLTLAPFPAELDPTDGSALPGQMYTGPWDAESGVVFEWIPSEDDRVEETITLTVQFLAKVDTDDENKRERVVTVPPSSDVEDDWEAAIEDGFIPEGTPVPDGRRPAFACETDDGSENGATWELDESLVLENGEYLPSLRGEPSHTLAEVTCSFPDRSADGAYGRFVLTPEIIEEALTYARANGAEGAVFSFVRQTTLNLETPPVRDRYGNRRDISPIKVVGNAAVLGRFWYTL